MRGGRGGSHQAPTGPLTRGFRPSFSSVFLRSGPSMVAPPAPSHPHWEPAADELGGGGESRKMESTHGKLDQRLN